ncbi:imidazole glycerol phosphate synthase subunit HisH [Flavobacterium kingsejongi]|uniref:Imidazole glycerol phosphate synthase subunit HisH n=1 Tax=Flavobacterium kingsejongi TaxID=1678728 RepID=A0A2S1LTU5_9FLAO|nr:imidazole glycerol phosphate synthase subunit HisH [Flavobacterium kingsejongi]AWG27071.1 imidazole glycerol phosphate synthase subunit HisH [Flavobacterium kingsejongi]
MIAIVKYNAGNTKSVENAVRRLGYDFIVTADENEIRKADKVIFPGVGEAGSAMQHLQATGLDQVLRDLTQPVLGICLGLQLMCASSEESETTGLGIFDVVVKKFPPRDKVPHMGWNNFTAVNGSLFSNVQLADDVYYVHSYYAAVSENTIGICDYILPFSAALQKDNFYAVQFHTEKSGAVGIQILKNFLAL